MVAQFISTNLSQDVIDECSQVFSQMTLALTKFANSNYKTSVYLDPREIDRVKDALNNFVCDNERASEFKNELMNDLTVFQTNISKNHIEKIKDFSRAKKCLEGEISMLEREKNKIVFERLANIEWPYTNRTQQIDAMVAQKTAQIASVTKKIDELQNSRPTATEKDLLVYKIQLKEKYSLK